MLDHVEMRGILDQMGIEWPHGLTDPFLGRHLEFDPLEIRRLRQLIESRLGVQLPYEFRISRGETVGQVAENVNALLSMH